MIIEQLEISKAGGRLLPHVEQVVDANGEGVTDATVVIQLVRCSDGFILDWSDATFKSSGWTTATQTVAHVANGLYYVAGDFEQAGGGAADVDMIDGELLRVIGTVTPSVGPVVPIESRLLQCSQSIYGAATLVTIQTRRLRRIRIVSMPSMRQLYSERIS